MGLVNEVGKAMNRLQMVKERHRCPARRPALQTESDACQRIINVLAKRMNGPQRNRKRKCEKGSK